MTILVVTSVAAEARAVGAPHGACVITGGIGRANAAAATTEAIIRSGPYDAVLCAGIAGALPAGPGQEPPALGETLVATACVYAEEGLMAPDGFQDMRAMGLALGPFDGNVVPVDAALLAALRPVLRAAPIATVATCSGTDAAAADIARRTGAAAEAMEGAAVVHAALRLHVPAIEVRTISNTTGDRDRQVWDLDGALATLGPAVQEAVGALLAV